MADWNDPKYLLQREESISRLDNLLDFVSPEELREYLLEIYHYYIRHEHDSLPEHFSDMAQGLQILFDFLKFLKEEQQGDCLIKPAAPLIKSKNKCEEFYKKLLCLVAWGKFYWHCFLIGAVGAAL
jgi:hypothetical protein